MLQTTEQIISEQELLDLAPSGVSSIYLEGIKFLRIERQPQGRYNHVSARDNVLTNFQMAERYGVMGLIAHNYLAGRYFSQLKVDDHVYLMDGKGGSRKYRVDQILKFRAVRPRDPRSWFEDLQDNEMYTAAEVFRRIYMGNHQVVLQTCIAQGDLQEWGRLFLVCKPV